MIDPLAPGATIGILGGGQLGRMMAVASSRLGLRCHIYDPDPAAPAGEVAATLVTAAYDDETVLSRFAEGVDVLTYEFENVPAAALDLLEGRRPVRPGREALRISQDRLTEKTWLEGLGLRCAPFADVRSEDALRGAVEAIGLPAILKTRRFGYDGKGQVRITAPDEIAAAWSAMRDAPAILEGHVDFECEISVIGARGADGRVACFDPGENVHVDGILRTTTVPARIASAVAQDAVLLAGRILTGLDYVGVLGVELFVTPDGLLVNEIAPRVHNSGHWTQDGATIDQFEQHVRAIAGWPLGDGARHSDIVMENLIGDEINSALIRAADPTVALHLYGKSETRAGRKMGHLNRRIA